MPIAPSCKARLGVMVKVAAELWLVVLFGFLIFRSSRWTGAASGARSLRTSASASGRATGDASVRVARTSAATDVTFMMTVCLFICLKAMVILFK